MKSRPTFSVLAAVFVVLLLETKSGQGTTAPPNTSQEQESESKTSTSCPINNPEANKKLILRLYDEVLANKNVTYINEFFAENSLEHNPYVADGLEARKLTLTEGNLSGPPVKIDIQRIIADQDFVWVHSKFPILKLNIVFAVVDIFRFKCGIIHEHWDVLQNTKLNVPSLNPHPFF